MKTLGALLVSAGRTEILRALVCQSDPVGLRQVARIAGVHPRSAELALAGLLRENLVISRPVASRAQYELNRSHEDAAVLEAVFLAAAREITIVRSRSLKERARRILPFIREARRMIDHARGSRHVA